MTSRCRLGLRPPERGDGFERVLDLLVWHQPGQHRHPGRARPRLGQGVGRRFVQPVADHRDAIAGHPELDEVARGRQRHRHVLVVAVQPRRQRRLDEPPDPAEHPARHRPHVAMAVVHEHDGPSAEHQPGQERQAVLRVDHHVRPQPPQRSEPQSGCDHRQPGQDVHRVPAACAADRHAVDHLAASRPRVVRGAQRHLDTRRRELAADALQVRLAAAALRVGSVAPTQQQRGADRRWGYPRLQGRPGILVGTERHPCQRNRRRTLDQ